MEKKIEAQLKLLSEIK